MTVGQRLGKVIYFFSKISVAEVKVVNTIRLGDKIKIIGPNTNITQEVRSMEIEHKKIQEAKPGDDIGLEVEERVPAGCCIFKAE